MPKLQPLKIWRHTRWPRISVGIASSTKGDPTMETMEMIEWLQDQIADARGSRDIETIHDTLALVSAKLAEITLAIQLKEKTK
jgi:hypothetical protein